MKQIAIIGGGVAGLSAAVYALRAGAKVTLFEQYGLGGLTATIDKIENYPGFKSISGWELAQDMANQAKALGLNVVRQKVLSLDCGDEGFSIVTETSSHTFPSVVIAVGTSHNKLGIEGDFVGKGVSYCATCDGNFFRGGTVAVVGNGSQAVREAVYLCGVAKTVYVIFSGAELNADEAMLAELNSCKNAVLIPNTVVSAINGKEKVSSVTLFDGQSKTLNLDCLFVAVGSKPNTDWINIDGLNKRNGYLVVDERRQTSIDGLFAAGDVTDGKLKQIVTACGDGALAGSFAAAYAARKK